MIKLRKNFKKILKLLLPPIVFSLYTFLRYLNLIEMIIFYFRVMIFYLNNKLTKIQFMENTDVEKVHAL